MKTEALLIEVSNSFEKKKKKKELSLYVPRAMLGRRIPQGNKPHTALTLRAYRLSVRH